jgi:hypothetical protein
MTVPVFTDEGDDRRAGADTPALAAVVTREIPVEVLLLVLQQVPALCASSAHRRRPVRPVGEDSADGALRARAEGGHVPGGDIGA